MTDFWDRYKETIKLDIAVVVGSLLFDGLIFLSFMCPYGW
jgi:hypothetical protein